MRTRTLLLSTIVLALAAGHQVQAAAEVITFDDLGIADRSQSYPLPGNYAGLTWGANEVGTWGAIDRDYDDRYGAFGVPHSGECMAFNGWAASDLWFEFAAPVTFEGAWFSRAPGAGSPTDSVWLSSDRGDTSETLTLTDTPQFLAAKWAEATRITVHQGVWGVYAMDDVTYNNDSSSATPELSTWALLGCSGLLGVGMLRRRRVA